MSLNKALDQLIIHADGYNMTRKSAIQAIANYANDLDLLAKGVSFKDLGISKRRKAMAPVVISVDNGSIVDRYELAYSGENIPKGSYAKLTLSGTMRTEDGMSSRGIKSMAQDIQTANANPNISGILIEATTGGGESLSGQILKNAIKDSSKPVLVYAHYLGSAGVHGTLTADHIMAGGNTSEVGSIGTMVSIDKGVAEWYKENIDDIYSDASPNKNNEWREYLKGNKGPFVELVKQDATHFQNEVRKYRNLSGDVGHTLSGAMLSADVALERGLIDSIGTFQEAIKVLDGLVGQASIGDNNSQQFFQNQEIMFDKLKESLSTTFGWEFGKDSTVSDVVDKIQSIEDQRQTAQDNHDSLSEKIEAVCAENTAIQAEIAANKATTEAQIEKVTKNNEELATKIEGLMGDVATREEEAKKVADAIALKTGKDRNGDNAGGSTVSEKFAKKAGIEFEVNLYGDK